MTPLLTLAGWLFDATAKGSVVIVLVALTQLVIGKRVDARLRHALWLLVVLRLMIPSAPSTKWSIFNLLPSRPEVPVGTHVVSEPVPLPPPLAAAGITGRIELLRPEPLGFWRWIIGIWLAGVVVLALRMLIATLRIHLALRNATVSAHQYNTTLDDARAMLGITR